MLKVKSVDVAYGDVKVLHNVSLEVEEGEVVALVGANGAGKTTLLRTISGLIRPLSGSIEFEGIDTLKVPPYRLPEMGIAHVPQGRQVFAYLSVEENLELGAYLPQAKKVRKKSMEVVFDLFPVLRERRRQSAGTLSGGEQQMLAVGRALMSLPKLLMLDEPSLGLAPVLVEAVYEKIGEIKRQGIAILLIEQNLLQALSVAHRGYVLEMGRIVLEGESSELLNNRHVKEAYLGI